MRSRIVFMILFGALTLDALTVVASQTQSSVSAPRPERFIGQGFEVVSVRENPLSWREAGPPSTSISPSGRFIAVRETVLRLIMQAYKVRDYQIVDAPGWTSAARFDISANAPEGFEASQLPMMLRQLLSEYFGLTVREEARMMPAYSLDWNNQRHKLGEGILPSSASCRELPNSRSRNSARSPGLSSPNNDPQAKKSSGECPVVAGWGQDTFYLRNSPISALLPLLQTTLGRPVFDGTGLTGTYDVDLYVPGILPSPQSGDAAEVSIVTAIREQLGLRLIAKKAEIPVLIVDHVDRPK